MPSPPYIESDNGLGMGGIYKSAKPADSNCSPKASEFWPSLVKEFFVGIDSMVPDSDAIVRIP